MDLIDQSEYKRMLQDEHLERLRHFLRLDESRRGYRVEGKPFILDRSFYTLYAFEYAAAKMSGSPVPTHMLNELANFQVIVPSAIVFMEISEDERARRLALRGPIDGPFPKEDFNRYNREFFERLSKFTQVAFVDCNSLSREEVTAKILSEFSDEEAQTVDQATENLRAIFG